MIEIYEVQDKDGRTLAVYGRPVPPQSYRQACDLAKSINGRVIALHYSFDDSELLNDFTEDDHVNPLETYL